MCIHPGCKTIPGFNKEGQKKGLYCSSHKKVGMVDVVSKKCFKEGCKKHPLYNKEGQKKGLYCSSHKKVGMVDVTKKRCKYL